MAASPPPIPLPIQIHHPAFIPRPPPPANPPTPADHVNAVNYVKWVEAASGDRLFMHLRKEYTHNVIAAVSGATNIQLNVHTGTCHVLMLPLTFQVCLLFTVTGIMIEVAGFCGCYQKDEIVGHYYVVENISRNIDKYLVMGSTICSHNIMTGFDSRTFSNFGASSRQCSLTHLMVLGDPLMQFLQ
jgi:hypothetical protein